MNFMCDLETRGNTPGCAILSIGLIQFDPLAAKVDDIFEDFGFYAVVSAESCLDNFLHEDPETMEWWGKQSSAARQVIAISETADAVPLDEALDQMVDYVAGHCKPKDAKIYGNGADFDNAILNVAARQVGKRLPWSYGGRCYRTLKSLDGILGPEYAAPPIVRSGTHHNALDDAKDQAMHLWEIVQHIRDQHWQNTPR